MENSTVRVVGRGSDERRASGLRTAAPHAAVDPPFRSITRARRGGPGAAGLGWVGLALAVSGLGLVAVVPLALGTAGGQSARLVGYLALVTAALVATAGVVLDRARRAGVIGLVLTLAGLLLVATLR